jgi:tRNA A-37 threonylcarbamoyl transferase component Bud32
MTEDLLTHRDLAGTLLASRYELRALVGRGGMGEVYEAVDRQLDRTVAVKVLRHDLAADRRLLTRFRREARTSARLSHQGIVAVHDIGEGDGLAFIVMEFVAGRTLARVVQEAGPLSPPSAATFAAEAADALAHAHDRGVVHRDISPGNVMVTFGGRIKVLDFGIARTSQGSGRSSSPSMQGTVAYVAPERIRGEAGDQRVDIYALGAVLHELLTGSPPMDSGPDAAAVVPPALAAIVRRCLEGNPHARFNTAEALAAALRATLDGSQPPPTRGPTPRAGGAMTEPIPPRTRTATLPPASTITRTAGHAARRPRPGKVLTILAAAVVALGAGWVGVSALPLHRVIEPTLHGPPPVPAPAALSVQTACGGWLSTRAELDWTPGGASDGYEILRDQPGIHGYVPVARIRDWRTTSFSDTHLGVDATYDYVVRAVDGPRVSAPTKAVPAPTPLLCLT